MVCGEFVRYVVSVWLGVICQPVLVFCLFLVAFASPLRIGVNPVAAMVPIKSDSPFPSAGLDCAPVEGPRAHTMVPTDYDEAVGTLQAFFFFLFRANLRILEDSDFSGNVLGKHPVRPKLAVQSCETRGRDGKNGWEPG